MEIKTQRKNKKTPPCKQEKNTPHQEKESSDR